MNSVEFYELLDLSQYELSDVLLKTNDDYQDFYIGFYGKNKYVIDDLLDYRENKLAKSNITLEDFKYMCYNGNMLDVFESVFLQKFTNEDMILVNLAIIQNRIALESLYNNFQKNTNQNILKNVL